MLRLLDATTRKALVRSRIYAMTGDTVAAVDHLLDLSVSQGLPDLDQVAVLMLAAEIKHLDGDPDGALSILHDRVEGKLALCPLAVRLNVADNENEAAFGKFQMGRVDHYSIQDYRRLGGIDVWDARSVFSAQESARAGEHYDALPGLWRQVLRAYESGNWRTQRWASTLLSREWLSLGAFENAAYHCLLAQDRELSLQIGAALLSSGQPDPIRRVVENILWIGNLLSHAVHGCVVLEQVADAVPDDLMERTVTWLARYARTVPEVQTTVKSSIFSSSWRALRALSARLSPDQSSRIVDLAMTHEAWNGGIPYRKQLVEAANPLIAGLPVGRLKEAAERSLPLATERKSDYDYVEAINLLCHIAERGGEPLRSYIATVLYPPGETRINAVLLQVAGIFGKKPMDATQLEKLVDRVIENTLRQVQHLKPGQEALPVFDTFGTYTSAENGERIVVQMAATFHLETVIHYSHVLPDNGVLGLVKALLAAIEEPDNMLSNKIALMQAIGRLGGRFPESLAEEAFRILSPIASGVIDRDALERHSAAQNPLNPFKINDSSPEDYRGIALYTLALLEREHAGVFGQHLNPIIERTLTDSSKDLRMFAFAAVRELPMPTEFMLTGVVFGTRDPDPDAAATAFDALASKKGTYLINEEQCQLLVYSLSSAAQASNVKLRRLAATALSLVREKAPERVHAQIEALAEGFSKDICYSVRNAIARISSEAPNEMEKGQEQAS